MATGIGFIIGCILICVAAEFTKYLIETRETFLFVYILSALVFMLGIYIISDSIETFQILGSVRDKLA